ncbi:MAG TPA: tripartite tricarboxylate transporter substrate-binding protein, partial [Ottowia sp.]|nr:tripartite tricarboxylate transporter substrate-binding protein [Ottowia sp.]
LLRGDTQFAFPIAATALPQIQGGKLRALAITSAERASALPEVPTLHELLGSKLAVQEAWSGLWAPARTPPEVVQRLFAALGSTLKTPAARKIIEAGGGQLAASASPQAYAEFIRAENAKWTEIVRLIGLTPN